MHCTRSMRGASRWHSFSRRHFCWADSTNRSTIANAVLRLRQPRVFTARKRAVPKKLSTGFGHARVPPVFGRIVAACQQVLAVLEGALRRLVMLCLLGHRETLHGLTDASALSAIQI